MTREEAIEVLHELDGQLYETQIVALKMAIKALEQDTVSKESYDHDLRKELELKIDKLKRQLDKIRTEIEKEIIPRNSDQYDHEAMWQNCGLRMALKILDKYKAEFKPQEGVIKE